MGISIENELNDELEFAFEKGEESLNERARELCIFIEETRRDLCEVSEDE